MSEFRICHVNVNALIYYLKIIICTFIEVVNRDIEARYVRYLHHWRSTGEDYYGRELLKVTDKVK